MSLFCIFRIVKIVTVLYYYNIYIENKVLVSTLLSFKGVELIYKSMNKMFQIIRVDLRY